MTRPCAPGGQHGETSREGRKGLGTTSERVGAVALPSAKCEVVMGYGIQSIPECSSCRRSRFPGATTDEGIARGPCMDFLIPPSRKVLPVRASVSPLSRLKPLLDLTWRPGSRVETSDSCRGPARARCTVDSLSGDALPAQTSAAHQSFLLEWLSASGNSWPAALLQRGARGRNTTPASSARSPWQIAAAVSATRRGAFRRKMTRAAGCPGAWGDSGTACTDRPSSCRGRSRPRTAAALRMRRRAALGGSPWAARCRPPAPTRCSRASRCSRCGTPPPPPPPVAARATGCSVRSSVHRPAGALAASWSVDTPRQVRHKSAQHLPSPRTAPRSLSFVISERLVCPSS